MNRCSTPLAILALIISGSVWHAPVLAAPPSDAAKPAVPVAKGANSFSVIPEAAAQALQPQGARKLENVPVVFESARSRREAPTPLGGLPETRQDAKLSLLQNSTDPLAERARTRSDSPPADKEAAGWARVDDSPNPEPGTWAVLIAGILGICAVARPRIFHS